MAANDDFRFADPVIQRTQRELGAYAGDVVPMAMTRSATGVTRGEELFARPELARPWRTSSAQRHAEVVISKEQEIEQLTKKVTEFRSKVAISNREQQKMQTEFNEKMAEVKRLAEADVKVLNEQLVQVKKELADSKSDADKQLKTLKGQHDAELAKLSAKLRQASDTANEMSVIYLKQLDDVKSSAAREVDLIQQLCNARTAELSEELTAAQAAIRKLQERNLVSLGDLQGEMRRNETRLLEQLKEQEKRFEALRTTLQSERQVVEVQRDKVSGERNESVEQLRQSAQYLNETEQRFHDWNARLLSDLDQIYEYYAAMIREVEKETADSLPQGIIPQGKVTDVYIPPRLASEPIARVSMDRIVERLSQLMLMKQSHTSASQALLRKLRNVETNSAAQLEATARTVGEKETQLTKLLSETIESRQRQDRLEKALGETQLQFQDIESRLQAATVRLQFFNDDLASALSSPAATVAPPTKDVTFVLLSVEGANLLWENDPQAAHNSILLMNNAIRAKMAQYGAYECFSDGTTMMLAFHDPLAACRFALETQVWLMELPWPPAVQAHYNTAEEYSVDERGNRFLVFRGLRVAMAIHAGEVEMEPTGLPVGIGESRVHYYGKTILQALHIASMALGGQIVVSNQVWQRCKLRSEEFGSPHVQDLGDHRLTVTQRGAADATSEVLTLVQILPQQLKARQFSRQQMFDARKHVQGGDGITPQLSHIRRSTLTDEVTSMKSRQAVVRKAMETLQDESTAVATSVDALIVKIREAKIGAHTFSANDLGAQASALDRITAKTDVIKSDLTRVTQANEELQSKVKALEEALTVHSRVTMSEDDFRRRMEIANERCNQQIYEANAQCEHKLQQMKAALTKSEQMNVELRRQLLTAPPSSAVVPLSTEQVVNRVTSVSSRGAKTITPTSTRKPVRSASTTSPTFPDRLKQAVQKGAH